MCKRKIYSKFEELKAEIETFGDWNITQDGLRFEEVSEETRSIFNNFIKENGERFVQHLVSKWKLQVSKFLLVFDEDDLIATVGFTRSIFCFDDPQFVVTLMTVKKDRRNQGIGKRTLANILNFINVTLRVVIRSDNEASLGLFKSLGFEEERTCIAFKKEHKILILNV